MANYMNKYTTKQAYDADGSKQYPNVSFISGTNKMEYKPFEPIYRWHGTYEETGDYICDYDTNEKKDKAIKQVSYDNGQTWENVVPAEYSATTVIEYESEDCGYDGGGDDGNCTMRANDMQMLLDDDPEYFDSDVQTRENGKFLRAYEYMYETSYDDECSPIAGGGGLPTLYLYRREWNDDDIDADTFTIAGKIVPNCCCFDGCDCNDEEDPESMGCEDNGDGTWIGCPDNGCRGTKYTIYRKSEESNEYELVGDYPDVDCAYDDYFSASGEYLDDDDYFINIEHLPTSDYEGGWRFRFDDSVCDK